MDQTAPRPRLRAEIQAFVRLYQASAGTAIGLASVSLEGLDQAWRERIQRIRALPREAPRRKQMIEALIGAIEQSLWQRRDEIEMLRATDGSLAGEALMIARRGEPAAGEREAPSDIRS